MSSIRSLTYLLLGFCIASSLHAQAPVDYRDVGLIINDNDTNSVAIGNYFALRRDIPLRNIIHVKASTSETVDSAKFETMRAAIEQYLTANNLADSLNYLVTTKGVPLRVSRFPDGLSPRSSSVDAELMLLLGPYSPYIGTAGTVVISSTGSVNVTYHPYYQKNTPFTRSQYGIYLVTRLVGLTKEDVFALIDRSGPNTYVVKDSALFVFDKDPRPIDANFNNALDAATPILTARGWNVLLNNDSVYVTNQRNVIGYVSWGSNDHYDHHYTQYARPKNNWLPASIAETYVSTSARNFVPGGEAGQSRIADLIAEGCTGASGYVYEPYSFSLTRAHILFDRYTNGRNLAESFYMANPTMSWMAVVVGDPKTSIMTAVPSLPMPTATVSPSGPVCQNSIVMLEAHGCKPGTMDWFLSDSVSLKASGQPLDDRHPSWLGRDSVFSWNVPVPGSLTVCFVNRNLAGTGFAQVSIDVRPTLQAGFTRSADTLYLDEQPSVTVTDTTGRATTWSWDFGDGSPKESGSVATHIYTRQGFYTIWLTVSDGVCTRTVSASRLSVFPTRRPGSLYPVPVDCGIVQVSRSATRRLTLRNNTADEIIVSNVSIEGTHRNDFLVSARTYPATIVALDSMEWSITFTPADSGARSATLLFDVSYRGALEMVELTGRGSMEPAGVIPAAAAAVVRLHPNYPNPVIHGVRGRPGTVIPFEVNARRRVRIDILNGMGARIAVLVDEPREPGSHTVVWNADAVVPGVYFCRMESEGAVRTVPIVVLK